MFRFIVTFFDQIGVFDVPSKYIFISSAILTIAFLVSILVCQRSKWPGIAIGAASVVNFGIFYALNYTKGYTEIGFMRYWPFGAVSLLILIAAVASIWIRRKMSRLIPTAVIAAGLLLWSLIYSVGLESIYTFDNSSHLGFEDSMAQTIDCLERYYILRGHKEIDFDALREKYIPMARDAEDKSDDVAFTIALEKLAYEFHDGHVSVMTLDSNASVNAVNSLAGDDYGFSMLRNERGEIEAVLLWENDDYEAYKKGLYTGAVITKWNGVDIEEALASVECIGDLSFPLAENEDIVKPIYLAGMGGDCVEVTFLDRDGSEKTIEVASTGSYLATKNWMMIPYAGNRYPRSTQEFMVDDHVGCIVVGSETYDDYKDMFASFRNDYPEVKNHYIDQIENLRTQGMDSLVIDMRGNRGGYIFIGAQLVSLFSTQEHRIYTGTYSDETGIRKNNISGYTIQSDGRYADMPVVVLVNSDCISCGDQVVEYLSHCPNVTIMGSCTTNGSGQWNGGECLLSDGKWIFNFPVVLSLDEAGEVFIDAGADRATPIELDERIEMTDEAIKALYIDFTDYQLDYACEYLNR